MCVWTRKLQFDLFFATAATSIHTSGKIRAIRPAHHTLHTSIQAFQPCISASRYLLYRGNLSAIDQSPPAHSEKRKPALNSKMSMDPETARRVVRKTQSQKSALT